MTNLLPLDSFRQILGYSPYHFWGLAGSSVPITSACNALVSQYAWQDADGVGRAEIRTAIATAEQRLAEYLGYSPAPHYISETLAWPGFVDTALWRYGRSGSDGRSLALQLSEGQIQAVGTETLTLISNTVPVVSIDADSDGLNDTFVATVATSETDPNRLVVYFASGDRLDSAPVGPNWRIEPVTITIAGGTATIRGRAWLLVKPVLYEGARTVARDPATATNFVTTLAVYTRTTDMGAQATLTWESPPWPSCCAASSGSSTDPAAVGTTVARVGIRDAAVGLVTPGEAVYNATSGSWASSWAGTCRPPDRVTVNYLAGMALEDGQMARAWQTIVARLAAAELTRPICACEAANRELSRWQFDLARTGGSNDEAYGAISQADLNNPLGTRRGHVYAWRQITNLRHLRGFLP
jgi:hypothetical protein